MALADMDHMNALDLAASPESRAIVDFLADYSVETSPGAAEKTASFSALLPAGARAYIAALPGADFGAVVATARRELLGIGLIPSYTEAEVTSYEGATMRLPSGSPTEESTSPVTSTSSGAMPRTSAYRKPM